MHRLFTNEIILYKSMTYPPSPEKFLASDPSPPAPFDSASPISDPDSETRNRRGRPASRLAALSVLLCLACFLASSAWAYKAGEDADDTVAGLPDYANVAAYLADPDRNSHRYVNIGVYTFSRNHVEEFHQANTLTDDKLIKAYSNVAAYLADSGRANRLYADIGGNVYLVVKLEVSNNAGTLTDSNLPSRESTDFKTTAVGEDASATGYEATAVGESAHGTGDSSTAVGQTARAYGYGAVALGDHARAYSDRAVALGANSQVYGEHSTGLGHSADSYGDGATSVGSNARALGERTTALGRGARAGQGSSGSLGSLIECARHTDNSISGFVSGCYAILTAQEKADARLAQDDPSGEAFRQGIRTRLQGVLDGLAADRATAVGAYSVAEAERSTALGAHSVAAAERSTSVGYSARATGERSTALGAYSDAEAERSTAVGYAARAIGDRSTALGQSSLAGAGYATALGRVARALGEHSTAVGTTAHGSGDQTVALGRAAGAGAWVTRTTRYADAAAYLVDADSLSPYGHVVIAGKVYSVADLKMVGSSLTDATLPAALADASAVIAPSRYHSSVTSYLADSSRTDHVQVVIAGKVYNVADLEAVQNLDESSLPTPLKGASGAIALGTGAQAPAENAVALGLDARAVGANAIAIGARVSAGANEVVIGATDHAYRLPGLAASQSANTEVLTVDGNGRLSPDGGALHGSIAQNQEDIVRIDGTVSSLATSESVAAVRGDLGTRTDAASTRGTAFARIGQNREDIAAEATARKAVETGVSSLNTRVGSASDTADDAGSAYARIAKVKEDLGTATDGPRSDGNAYERIGALREILDTATSGDLAAANVLQQALQQAQQQAQMLVERLTRRAAPGEVLRDPEGNPVGTTRAEFDNLDAEIGSENRIGYLFEALYGDPTDGKVNNPDTDSDNPGEKSAFGRIKKLAEGDMEKGYDEAPKVGSGNSAPATADKRRVVVQDTNADGTVKLRTLDFSDLAGVDRRVTALSKRLDKATAMSSALSALPNMVPNGKSFYLGAGAGYYGGEQAVAIGISMGSGSEKINLFGNAGVAVARGDSMSARVGLGIAW